jgi:hypothetical protein
MDMETTQEETLKPQEEMLKLNSTDEVQCWIAVYAASSESTLTSDESCEFADQAVMDLRKRL